MGHQMAGAWHGHGWKSGHMGRHGAALMAIPLALGGMFAAFMSGALLGMIGGKKVAMHAGDEHAMWGQRWHGGHHHHGFGSPPCRAMHEMAAPGAMEERAAERNEGE